MTRGFGQTIRLAGFGHDIDDVGPVKLIARPNRSPERSFDASGILNRDEYGLLLK